MPHRESARRAPAEMPAPTPVPLVIHEPRTSWGRQLRARSAGWPVRIRETRSADQLDEAVRHDAIGLLLVDASDRPHIALDHLARVATHLSDWLVLFVDSRTDSGCAWVARELGATFVVARPVAPPEVAALLRRWVDVAQTRRASAGWISDALPNPDAWLAELVPALRGTAV